MFNYFISNKFKGLKFEFLTMNCPLCQYGTSKFSIEIWLNILNQIFLKENKKNGKNIEKNIQKNKNCTTHKNEEKKN